MWNLTERGYDYSKLDSNVRETGWPDHHAPPLVLLFCILLSIEDWLEADARNVVVLHCLVRTPLLAAPPPPPHPPVCDKQAGKGRTGLVVACQLFYAAQCPSMSAALRLFAERRSKTAKGVRQLSQLRYAYYVERALTAPVQLRERRLRLVAITMRTAPAFEQYYTPSSASYVLGCSPLVEVYRYFPPMSPENASGVVSDAAHHPPLGGAREHGSGGTKVLGHAFRLVYTDCQLGYRPKRQFTLFDDAITLPLDTVVQGDFLIKVLHHKERAMFNNRVEMFHCQINTMFVDEVDPHSHRLILTMPKADLNEAQNDSKFANSFRITLEFEDLDAPAAVPPAAVPPAAAPERRPSPLTAEAEATTVAAVAAVAVAASATAALAANAAAATQEPLQHPLQVLPGAEDSPPPPPTPARVRPKRGDVVSRPTVAYSEMPLDQILALMRQRFRERQRERAAAKAAALGVDDAMEVAAPSPLRQQSADASSTARRRHGDASAAPPLMPLVPLKMPAQSANVTRPTIVIDVDDPSPATDDAVLLALNRSLSSDPILRSLQVSNDQTTTLALDLASGRGGLSISHDGSFDSRAAAANTLKRSSDESVNLRRSRNRAQHSIGPEPAVCELCAEAPAVAKLLLADGNGVLACQSCSESRLVSRAAADANSSGANNNGVETGSDANAPITPTTIPTTASNVSRAMSFVDLGHLQ